MSGGGPSGEAPPSWETRLWPPTPPPWPDHPTTPPAPPLEALQLFAISDWGGETGWPETTPAQLACAAGMATVAQQLAPAAVLSAGDNFYDGGIVGAADSPAALHRFNTTWAAVYDAPALAVPWYVVAGNHDWMGNVSAEVAASALHPRWHMDALYYTFTLTVPSSQELVQLVMIDTESLVGGDAGQVDSAPPGIAQPAIDEAQWTWLEGTLAGSTADWLVVVGHFPVYSAGENGPTPLLVSRLLPLMEAAGVALYINGHDHQLEHISPVPTAAGKPGVVDMIVVGAGAKFNESTAHAADVPSGALKFQYGAGPGFASVVINRAGWLPPALTVSFWNSGGSLMYSFTKANPRLHFPGLPPAPPRPSAPPSPFITRSNKIAVMLGFAGLLLGCAVIFSGLAQERTEAARFEDPHGAEEKGGLLLPQQRAVAYGGAGKGVSAQRVVNRL